MRHDLSPADYQANRTLGVLSRKSNLAELWNRRSDGSPPCLRVKRFREEKRERFLTADEFNRLGRVLDEILEDGSETRSAVAAIPLLMLTGCRRMKEHDRHVREKPARRIDTRILALGRRHLRGCEELHGQVDSRLQAGAGDASAKPLQDAHRRLP